MIPTPKGWHIRSKGGMAGFPVAAGGVWEHNATAAVGRKEFQVGVQSGKFKVVGGFSHEIQVVIKNF
jgi:hypothetical protein